ncbi:MAG: hypothetical protein HUU50_04030 [Candidatus Brocadiae bacterium]|nr:hypothetical protein [Candidatus Brocadiia bacterium]
MKRKSLSRKAAVVGVGISSFGAFPDKAGRDLFVEAFQDMKVDKGFNPKDIEALYLGNFSGDIFEGQAHLAPIMADSIGILPCPATRVEDACASGGVALREGLMAIASGMYDMVLVGGVERMTALPTAQVTDALGIAADALYEVPMGYTFPGLYATMATAYMERYGMKPEDLMQVAIKNYENGALNPKAQFQSSLESIMMSKIKAAQSKGKPVPGWQNVMDFLHDNSANPIISWPLRLFDCSPISDGAAVLLLVSEEIAHEFTDHPIFVVGSGQASGLPLYSRPDLTTLPAAQKASQIAYQMAGVKPQDIHLAEVHDCFTIAELIAIEDLGLCPVGKSVEFLKNGIFHRNGTIPVNSSGGLKAKGHPVGASGVAQVYEIFRQLRGEAGTRQIQGTLSLGLTHNVGATGTTCVVHIFERK